MVVTSNSSCLPPSYVPEESLPYQPFGQPSSRNNRHKVLLQVVGASGAVMGFVGLTIADIAINSGDLPQVLLRVIIIVAAVTFFIVTAVTKVGLILPVTVSLYTLSECARHL